MPALQRLPWHEMSSMQKLRVRVCVCMYVCVSAQGKHWCV